MKHSELSALAIAFLMIAGAMAVAMNAAAWGEIDEEGIFETIEDFDDDGKINYLVINVPIQNISWYGISYFRDYIAIDWELWNETSTQNIGWGTAEQDITPYSVGNITVEVRISGRMINASGIDGPYLVKMWVSHFVGERLPIVWEALGYFEYITDEYAHDDFETPDPYTMSIDWEVVDDDDDGLHDWLRVNLTVNATDGDIVQISLELSAEVGPDLITCSDQRTLAAGYNQTVAVDIDGRLMNGLAREDTQYWIHISVATLDGFKDSGWVKTDPLNASDFEEYVISVVDGPVSTLIDFNDDGLHDFLRTSFNTTVQDTLKYRLTTRLSDENSSWGFTQYFDGYLLAGFEETVVAYFDTSEMFDREAIGPFELEITESPTAYGKWSNYSYIQPIVLANMSIEELDIDLLNHPDYISLSGYVIDEEGEPIADSEVRASSSNSTWGWYGSDTDTTDANGRYDLTDLIPWSVTTIEIESTGYFNETLYTMDLNSDTTNFNFILQSDLPANSEIWGTVFDIEGEPTPGAIVIVLRNGSVVVDTTSDEAGDYQIDIKAGDYVILTQALDMDLENFTFSVWMSVQWISLAQNESVNSDITLNLTYDMIEDTDMRSSVDLRFDSWDDLAMTSTLTQGSTYTDLVYWLYSDILLGNADGYVDADEQENIMLQELMAMAASYFILMGYYQPTPMQCEQYLLEEFSVDGIGYLAQPGDARLILPDMTGSIWEDRDETSTQLDFTNMSPYWPVPDGSCHELYLEVQYTQEEYAYIIDEGYDITVPEGFILTSTNEPENVTIDGLNHVTVVPGGSPDPYNATSVLVVLEFSSTTSEDSGSVHGTAILQDEEDNSGIVVELLDPNLTVLVSTTTAYNGEFAFPDLDPGEYWIKANISGYLDAFEPMTIAAGMTTEVSLELVPTGTTVELVNVSGIVVTQAGLPIQDALVEVYTPADGTIPTSSIQTDGDGAFELTDLVRGDYRIEISAEGFHAWTAYHILDDGEDRDLGVIELTSDSPVGYIVGSLEDTEGNPVTGIVVQVRADGSDTSLGENTTDPDGGFMIVGLEDGDYNLTFVLDGEIIGYGGVTVDDYVGDAGVIEVDVGDADVQGDDDPVWPLILLLAAVAAVAAVALVLKLRKPKSPQPTTVEGGEGAPVGPE